MRHTCIHSGSLFFASSAAFVLWSICTALPLWLTAGSLSVYAPVVRLFVLFYFACFCLQCSVLFAAQRRCKRFEVSSDFRARWSAFQAHCPFSHVRLTSSLQTHKNNKQQHMHFSIWLPLCSLYLVLTSCRFFLPGSICSLSSSLHLDYNFHTLYLSVSFSLMTCLSVPITSLGPEQTAASVSSLYTHSQTHTLPCYG